MAYDPDTGEYIPDVERPPAPSAPTAPPPQGGDFISQGRNPTPSELRTYAQQQGWSEDFVRFDDATLQGWINQHWDRGANKFRSGRGAEGHFEKPTECPPGMMPGGGSESDGCVPNPHGQGAAGGGAGGAGGGGGTGGGTGGGGGGGGWDQGLTQLYKEALTNPKAAQALVMMGGGQQFGADVDAMEKQIMAMEEGPAKEAMKAKLTEMRTTGKMGLRQAGAQVGLQGLTGLVPLHQDFAKFRQGLAENARQFNEGLAWDRDKFGQSLGWERDRFGQELGWNKERFGQEMDYNRWAKEGDWDLARDMKGGGFWDTMGGIFGNLFGASANKGWLGKITGFLSDVAVKENLAPGRRGLSDLRRVAVHSYNYKPEVDPTRKPTQGVIAQELEKVAPELVIKTDDGPLMVDGYGLLSMTMKAVQDLDKKIDKIKKEKK